MIKLNHVRPAEILEAVERNKHVYKYKGVVSKILEPLYVIWNGVKYTPDYIQIKSEGHVLLTPNKKGGLVEWDLRNAKVLVWSFKHDGKAVIKQEPRRGLAAPLLGEIEIIEADLFCFNDRTDEKETYFLIKEEEVFLCVMSGSL